MSSSYIIFKTSKSLFYCCPLFWMKIGKIYTYLLLIVNAPLFFRCVFFSFFFLEIYGKVKFIKLLFLFSVLIAIIVIFLVLAIIIGCMVIYLIYKRKKWVVCLCYRKILVFFYNANTFVKLCYISLQIRKNPLGAKLTWDEDT